MFEIINYFIKSEKSNRRNLFKKFGIFGALSFLSSSSFVGLRYYKVIIYNESISDSTKEFESVDDFWISHADDYSDKLNEQFSKSNRLIKIKTFLSKDKKSAYLVKYYRSKQDYDEYISLLSKYHLSNQFQIKSSSKVLNTEG